MRPASRSTSRSSTAPTSSTSSAAEPRTRASARSINLHVGSRLPAYCTAMGKALLAFVPDERLAEILDGVDLVARGPNTITDRRTLAADLARVRELDVASTTRSWRTGPLDRVADPLARQRRRRSRQPRRPPLDGLDRRPDRALRPAGAAHRSGDLGRARSPRAFLTTAGVTCIRLRAHSGGRTTPRSWAILLAFRRPQRVPGRSETGSARADARGGGDARAPDAAEHSGEEPFRKKSITTIRITEDAEREDARACGGRSQRQALVLPRSRRDARATGLRRCRRRRHSTLPSPPTATITTNWLPSLLGGVAAVRRRLSGRPRGDI